MRDDGRQVVERLVEYAPVVLGREPLRRNHCVLATAVGLDVLRAFDVVAHPLPVHVVVANRAYLAFLGKEYGLDECVKRGGYWLDSQPTDPEVRRDAKGWFGHLVIQVPTLDALIDLNLGAMCRAHKEIVLPAAASFVFPNYMVAATYDLPLGAQLRYTISTDVTWRDAKDWVQRAQRQSLVKAVVKAIKRGRV